MVPTRSHDLGFASIACKCSAMYLSWLSLSSTIHPVTSAIAELPVVGPRIRQIDDLAETASNLCQVSVTYLRSSALWAHHENDCGRPNKQRPPPDSRMPRLVCLEAFDPAGTAFDEPILQRLVVPIVYLLH
ncbi:hypothetical protein V2G26_004483 [Clonostachys chloroleuca]